MINKSIIDEWNKLPKECTKSIINSVKEMEKFVPIRLINTEKNELEYQVRLKDIYNSSMTFEDLLELRKGGWELGEYDEGEYLIKKI